MSLPQRKIGNDSVSAIGFGTMGLSAFYGEVESDEERFKVLDAVFAGGCNHWDTADVYADSEDLLGKWFRRTGQRDKIFLATKFGHTEDYSIRGDPEFIREAVEKSFKRLGVDKIDLLYAHRLDSKVPVEDTVSAMAEFVKSGRVKYLGLSEPSAASLRRAYAVHPISVIQVEYSVFDLDIEDPKIGLLKTARELGVKVVAYSPLARGLVTGQYKSPDDFDKDDFRRIIPRFSKENFPRMLKVSDALADIGKKHNATPGQVALAWLLEQGGDILPIPGTKKIKYLQENIGALKVVLTTEEIQAVRKLAEEADQVEGIRYPENMAANLFVDTPEKK